RASTLCPAYAQLARPTANELSSCHQSHRQHHDTHGTACSGCPGHKGVPPWRSRQRRGLWATKHPKEAFSWGMELLALSETASERSVGEIITLILRQPLSVGRSSILMPHHCCTSFVQAIRSNSP